MSTPSSPVSVVTGASTGFGFDTAKLLVAAGHRVFGTMRDISGRNAERAKALSAIGATPVELDVTDAASVDRGAADILAAARHVDVLVNNAGTAHFGTTEAFTAESYALQLATNAVGPFRVSRAFFPGMRERRSGLVIFVSSVVGRMVIPFTGIYTSSKWAIEGLAESLSYELRPFGVDVAIIEPGAYNTNIFNATIAPDDTKTLASYGDVAKTIEMIGADCARSDRSRASDCCARRGTGRDASAAHGRSGGIAGRSHQRIGGAGPARDPCGFGFERIRGSGTGDGVIASRLFPRGPVNNIGAIDCKSPVHVADPQRGLCNRSQTHPPDASPCSRRNRRSRGESALQRRSYREV